MTLLWLEESLRDVLYIFSNRFTWVDLVELNMVDFDFILGIDWLHAFFTSIDYQTRVVKFNFPNEPVLEWKG